jgi:hypothetical protein
MWLFLLPAPALAYGGLWWWERRRRALGANRERYRRRHAARTARGILKEARAAGAGERAVEAGRALRVYLADRYGLPRAGVTPGAIAAGLGGDGIEAEPVLAQLDACDAARYAPGGTDGDRDWVGEVDGWIQRLEKGR